MAAQIFLTVVVAVLVMVQMYPLLQEFASTPSPVSLPVHDGGVITAQTFFDVVGVVHCHAVVHPLSSAVVCHDPAQAVVGRDTIGHCDALVVGGGAEYTGADATTESGAWHRHPVVQPLSSATLCHE